jgi:ectoine hydroxylase-related dioxygenase (phytanoyl-CoA dioxygenase family)
MQRAIALRGLARERAARACRRVARGLATNPDEVRRNAPQCITEEQRDYYFQHGYLVLPGFLSDEWLERLNAATDEVVERSRGFSHEAVRPLGQFSEDDPLADKLVLAEGHTAEAPMLTRLSAPVDVHPDYWAYSFELAASIASDLLGPDVRFHHSKLNFKWPGALEEIRWHQDIQFWPHSNYTPLTLGVYLCDVTDEMGPMKVVPLSVHDELHPLTDPTTGEFTGVLSEESLARVATGSAADTAGPRGTVTIHNARCVHSSLPNTSARARPLLLNTFVSASAAPLHAGTNGIHLRSKRGMPIVRGEQPVFTTFDPRPCPMAPDFSSGYVTPFIQPAANRDG